MNTGDMDGRAERDELYYAQIAADAEAQKAEKDRYYDGVIAEIAKRKEEGMNLLIKNEPYRK